VYYWGLYANLNWAAWWIGGLFALQGAALLVVAVAAGQTMRPARVTWPGLAIAALGVAAYPFAGPFSGGAWAGVEVFGVAPVPTVVVALGLLAGCRQGWPLLVLPVAWSLLVAAPTAWVLDDPDGFAAPAASLAAAASWLLTARVRGSG